MATTTAVATECADGARKAGDLLLAVVAALRDHHYSNHDGPWHACHDRECSGANEVLDAAPTHVTGLLGGQR